ncbi:hypothetical protein BKA61DRAFT_625790 [Leptodontidium sp. MPI-SDFR-AT-0119]|nr:hypothetical protein BKA61DRAFT_625790 [Leptodontidium sp. MPI-SDFR-AT-0119]
MANETLPCDSFDSLTTMILAVSVSQINVTAQIQSCPGLCALAWGNGNPDFSGVGANLSWIFQAILTILLGPLLSICLFLEALCPGGREGPRIEAVHKDFLMASALVTIPVTFASTIYLRRVTFLFEVTYLYYLNAMQFLSLFSTALSGYIFNAWDYRYSCDGYEMTEKESRRSRRLKWAGAGSILALIFFLSVTVYINNSRLSFAFLPELERSCQAYSSIIPKMPKHVETPPANIGWFIKTIQWFWGDPNDPTPMNFTSFLKMYVGIILCILIVGVGGLLLVIYVIPITVFLVFRVLYDAIKACIFQPKETLGMVGDAVKRYSEIHPLAMAVPPLGFSIGMIYCLAQMQFDRNEMKAVLGRDYVDSQWGFGQIISLFLWAQVLYGVCGWILSLVKRVRFASKCWLCLPI